MMRLRTRGLLRFGLPLTLLGAGAAYAYATYPRIGAFAFRLNYAVERRRSGLSSRSVDVDGLRMAYDEGGSEDAPTVVLVHGYTADRTLWPNFARTLTNYFHVIVPDLAGHGETPFRDGDDFSGPGQADRLARMLDLLGVEDFHVFGNSMGGLVAAHLAHRHADRVLSLGLCDAVGATTEARSDAQQMLDRGEPNVFLLDSVDQFPRFYGMTMAKPPPAPKFVLDAMAKQYVDRRDQYEEIFDAFYETAQLDDLLSEITAPAMIVWGAQDQLVHPDSVDVWGRLPEVREVKVYEGVGHMPMVEIPRRSSEDYRAFLDSLGD
ncbi:alpha/beta hydrolase [Nocardioidaceae bacterium]|nr:alpha/beta hydrolase [Nocardioidaceae bacterium]